MARKHEARPQYVIVGTIQPQSNALGNTPLNVTASIMLEGVQLNFTARRQGSVYLYSPATGSGDGGAAAPPSFVQLDGWHEASHFSWWSHDFTFEAELHTEFQPADAVRGEALAGDMSRAVQTEVHSWRAGDICHDLTQTRSFVSLRADSGGDESESSSSSAPVSFAYDFEPRPVSRSLFTEVNAAFRSYRVELVMRRGRAGAGTKACVGLHLAATTADTEIIDDIGVACANGFEWESTGVSGGGDGVLRLGTGKVHRLVVRGVGGSANVDIDQLKLVQVSEE